MTPAARELGHEAFCHALLPVVLRPSLLPDSSSFYPPFYEWGGVPARVAQDSWRKFRAAFIRPSIWGGYPPRGG